MPLSDWRQGAGRKLRAEDGPHWTPTEKRRRDEVMRQFVKGDGPRGNSEAYRDGWERIWGSKRGSESGTEPPESGEESGT